jgi:hypothetical protein
MDALKLYDIYPMPYIRQRNLHTGVVYDYRKRDDYKRFTSGQLDPMHRWKFNLISFEELLFVRWFVDDDYASRIGILVEAIVLSIVKLATNANFESRCDGMEELAHCGKI